MMGFRSTHFSLLYQPTRRWHGWRGLLLALLALLSMGEAAANCTYSVNASPAYPTTFYVNPTRNLTSPFFTTTLTYKFSCEPVNSPTGASIFYFDALDTVNPLVGPITGVSVSTGTITITPTTLPTCSRFTTRVNAGFATAILATGPTSAPSCDFDVAVVVNYYTNGAAYTNDTSGQPNKSSTDRLLGNGSGVVGKYFVLDGSVLYGKHTATTATGLNSFSMAVNNRTCVATVADQTVALDSVSEKYADLKFNRGAANKAFTVGVTGCSENSGGGFPWTLKAKVDFTASPVDTTWLDNTATSPAANVYIQILNASQLQIRAGDLVTMTQNGDTTFAAQYMTTVGKTAGPGAVKGTFTLTFSYQ